MDSTQLKWTPEALREVSAGLEARSPEDILKWGLDHFGGEIAQNSRQTNGRQGIALATGFGPEGVVLMHMLSQLLHQPPHPNGDSMAQLAPGTTVFYTDTDLLFEETYALRDELSARLGIQFTRLHSGLSLEAQAAQHGPALWSRDPDLCCQLRKVAPLRQFLRTKQAWISAIRRDQTANRASAGLVEWDRSNGLVKLNPLAAWTTSQVWSYVLKYQLPYNPLHDQGYPSIGCWPCTKAVAAGADPRSGRWAGLGKTECGIHLPAAQPA
jgi:phosphoadenosine phosphosulfate reductase